MNMSNQMLSEFKTEAKKMLDSAKTGLESLNQGGDFSTNMKAIYKALNSIKGAAGMFGFMDVQVHTGKLSVLIDSLKNKGSLSNDQIQYFKNGIDVTFKLLEGESIEFSHVAFTEIDNGSLDLGLPKKNKTKGLIFIIDNDAKINEALALIVSKLDFTVKTFLDYDSFQNLIPSESPDLIVHGLSITDLLKLKEIKPEAPVIVSSNKLNKELIFEFLKADVRGFIEKPHIDENHITLEIERVFQHSQANSLLKKSINYILYQFSELDTYLKSTGKDAIRNSLKDELKNILNLKEQLYTKSK